MVNQPSLYIPKRCVQCGQKVRRNITKCPDCGQRLHGAEDCNGCINLVGEDFCKIFIDIWNPIMKEDGTCQGRAVE